MRPYLWFMVLSMRYPFAFLVQPNSFSSNNDILSFNLNNFDKIIFIKITVFVSVFFSGKWKLSVDLYFLSEDLLVRVPYVPPPYFKW